MMRCPRCHTPLAFWRVVTTPKAGSKLRCPRCRARLRRRPRTRVEQAVDWLFFWAILLGVPSISEVPWWRTVITFALLLLAGAWVEAQFAELEPAPRA